MALGTGIALALALAAGSWLSWRFTRPLTALAEGARAQAEDALLRNSERLLRLVNDLLELARLDLHELPLHCRPVDVRELVAAAVRSIQPAARSLAGNHSGLGLKIARALAEAHGGSLTLQSVPGQGTTVTVILHEK